MNKSKSQAFLSDFVVAALIFVVIIVIYFNYTRSLSAQDSSSLEGLLADAKIISSSLTSGGYPDNWQASTVVRIGFTDDSNRIDNTKFGEFVTINYNKTRRLLGATNEYFLFFVNESGNVTNVEGFCGFGNALVNVDYDIKAAYYYKDPEDVDQYLKSFMEDEFDADVYTEDGIPNGINDLFDLRDNRNNYDVIVLEAPEWSGGGQYNNVKDEFEEWTSNGGFLMISGELVSGQKKQMVGASFEKGAGLSSPQERATVVNTDEYLSFQVRDGLVFDQGFTAKEEGEAANFKDIARFNESDVEFNDILNNKIAIARWEYGNGKVFFFSDFDAEYFQGNFLEQVKSAFKRWAGAKCLPIDISNIKRDKLVRIDRILIYNSRIVKMVLYVWS